MKKLQTILEAYKVFHGLQNKPENKKQNKTKTQTDICPCCGKPKHESLSKDYEAHSWDGRLSFKW